MGSNTGGSSGSGTGTAGSGNASAGTGLFEEIDGLLAVEAEHFVEKSKNGAEREWLIWTSAMDPGVTPDPDGNHADSASGKANMELLPDTRVTHDDSLSGAFWGSGGKGPLLTYKVWFNTPGTYLVWVRAYSTGGEDNGIHVGINGTWPATGERVQFCTGKNSWTWSSAQRTNAEHCGVPRSIQIEVPSAGEHTVQFSAREDGFEFDKFVMALDHRWDPTGAGPDEKTR